MNDREKVKEKVLGFNDSFKIFILKFRINLKFS